MKIEQGMTRAGRRLVEDFLLPALNDGRYGDRLKWVDKDNLYFSIKWSHKNAAKWSLEDTVVFQDWDRMKGHYHPEIKGYYMQAKQRFRAALYKLNTVRKIRCTDKQTKLYQLVLENDKRKNLAYCVMKQREIERLKGGNNCQEDSKFREGIPTSVIRVNENYIPSNRPMITRMDHQYAAPEDMRPKSPTPTDDLLMFEDSMSTESMSTNSSTDSPENGIIITSTNEVDHVIEDVKYSPVMMVTCQSPPPMMVLVTTPTSSLPSPNSLPCPSPQVVAKVIPKVEMMEPKVEMMEQKVEKIEPKMEKIEPKIEKIEPKVEKNEIKTEVVSRPPHPHIPVQALPQTPKSSATQPLYYSQVTPMYPITVQIVKKQQMEAKRVPMEYTEGALNLSKKPVDSHTTSSLSVSARHNKESYLNALGLRRVKIETPPLSPSEIKQEIEEDFDYY